MRGKHAKQIIIPDRPEVDGWWQIMRFVFERAERDIVNPDYNGKNKGTKESTEMPDEGSNV